VRVDKPAPSEPIAAPAPEADTWAANMRRLVAQAHADLQACRNDYMIPFQFEKMRARDVTWLAISTMDAVCRDGDRAAKKRGPWSIVQFLAKDHAGKNATLDRYIALAHDHIEHARLVSLMTKKVGSPKIAAVVEVAKTSRDRVLEAGRLLDEAARDVAAFPDDLAPDSGPEAAGQELDRAAFAALVRGHYGFLLGDAVGAYDRLASQSWQAPNMVKRTTLKLWAEIPTRHLQQDRPRLARVKALTDADRKRFDDYFARCDALLAAWTKSYERYIEDKEGDTWAERDPWRPAVVKAHKAWQKAHESLAALAEAGE
jgi:hypothetical protein